MDIINYDELRDSTKERSLFFVPYWIELGLKRNGLPINTVFDLVKLKEVFSVDDLVPMAVLNKDSARVLGCKEGFYNYRLGLHWDTTGESAVYHNTLRELEPLYQTTLEDRLYNEVNRSVKYPKPFELKESDHQTIIVIIYPGFFHSGNQAKENSEALLTSFLKLWYGYSGYTTVANSPLFETYVKSLAA